MKILVDLNVLLDVIEEREPHYAASAEVLSRIAWGEIEAAIPGHALTTVHYVLSKRDGKALGDRGVDWVLSELEIVPEGRELFLRARSLRMPDFEDAVVSSAAEQARCDRIVTRNIEDFNHSHVLAVTPVELCVELDLAAKVSSP